MKKKESERLALRFARMNSLDNLKGLLSLNLRLAKVNGFEESFHDPAIPKSLAFYLKLFLLLSRDEIKSATGEDVVIGLDITNRDAVQKKYEELGNLKNTLVRKQNYVEAARYRDQQKWLLRYM